MLAFYFETITYSADKIFGDSTNPTSTQIWNLVVGQQFDFEDGHVNSRHRRTTTPENIKLKTSKSRREVKVSSLRFRDVKCCAALVLYMASEAELSDFRIFFLSRWMMVPCVSAVPRPDVQGSATASTQERRYDMLWINHPFITLTLSHMGQGHDFTHSKCTLHFLLDWRAIREMVSS